MEEDTFITTASLLCEPSRARIVWNLLDGRAYTATELASVSDLSPTSVSNHLSKLLKGEIVKVDVQGKHRYYSFASEEVAYVVESLANFGREKRVCGPEKPLAISDIKYCRSCYDHLAGKVGVRIADSLLSRGMIRLQNKNFEITEKGDKFFRDFGLEVNKLQNQRRHFAKACLDWSERKYHLAGALGAALFDEMLRKDWLRRTKNSRVIVITSRGQIEAENTFGIEI